MKGVMIKEFLSGGCKFQKALIKNNITEWFHEDALMYLCHPFNQLVGVGEIISIFYEPLCTSFDELKKTPSICIAGEVGGDLWISSKGVYRGIFNKEWLDIPPTYKEMNLGYGEFHRLKQGKIIETRMLLDLPDLIKQSGTVLREDKSKEKTPYRPKEETLHLIDGSFHALLSWVKGSAQKEDIRRMDWWSHGGDLPLDHYWMRDELRLKLDQGIDVLEEVQKSKDKKTY
ncbi:ester cyclase [Isachenkonia alkalipeptolytica]|uniref:Ester cyclase n=1 Tax=Isachenkonia alkalipeptolytica TaxID=2565777 RepID=A0AA43XKV6_9CLOT|nr:ester cyclase [Isachenkonia alkalipeptolytica]NBG88191.1 ester cyclase [Isachenkonia alkalipeptolytica]